MCAGLICGGGDHDPLNLAHPAIPPPPPLPVAPDLGVCRDGGDTGADAVGLGEAMNDLGSVDGSLEQLKHHIWCLAHFLRTITFPPWIRTGNDPSREHWLAVHSAFSMLARAEACIAQERP